MTRSLLSADQRHGTCNPWLALRDEDLLAEYVEKGTHEAFEELVHRYERPLYCYLRRFLGNAGLVEDAFQTTFLEVHLHCRQFDPNLRFRPWVYRIATTRAIDLLRRNHGHKLVSLDARQQSWDTTGNDRPPEELPDSRVRPAIDQLETNESRQRLRLLVDALPARLKTVVDLIMFRGLAYQDAAEALGIPLGTVKSRMHNAILNLRKTIVAAA